MDVRAMVGQGRSIAGVSRSQTNRRGYSDTACGILWLVRYSEHYVVNEVGVDARESYSHSLVGELS